MMDLVSCIIRLRPDVTWKGNMVNGHSLETIAKTYQSSESLPAEGECLEVWQTLKAEYLVKEEIAEGKKAERLINLFIKKTYLEIKDHIDSKVPPSGQTLEINKILNILAKAVKSLS